MTNTIVQALIQFAFDILAFLAISYYWLIPKFAGKWIDTKFAKQLQDYKNEQDRENKRLDHELKLLQDKLSKYSEKEYEVLPQAWEKLLDAYWKAGTLLSGIKSARDLSRMSKLELEDFIESSNLYEWEKKTLRETNEKQNFYSERMSWHELDEALTAYREFHRYLEKNGILLQHEIQNQFKKIDDLIWDAVRGAELNKTHEYKVPVKLPKEQIDALLQDLQKDIQARLCQ